MSGSVPHEDWPLSELGQKQAQQAIPLLQSLGIEKIYSSPYRRCRETVTPFIENAKIPVDFHDDLREHRLLFGWIDDFQAHWAKMWKDFHFALPDCESSHQAQTRFTNALTSICKSSEHNTLGISTHGAVIGLFLHGLHPQFTMKDTKKLRNLEVLKLEFKEDAFTWHETFHLRELDKIATPHHLTPFIK